MHGLVHELSQPVLPCQVMAAWATIHGQAVLQLDQHLVATFGVEDDQAEATARAVIQTLVDGLGGRRRSSRG